MAEPHGAPLPVTTSLEDALARAAGGGHVVLVTSGPDTGPDVRRVVGDVEGGRVHRVIGDAADPTVQAAAAEMAAELGARLSG